MDTDKKIPAITNVLCDLSIAFFWPALLIIAAVIGISVHFGIHLYWIVVMCLPFLLAGVAILWWPVIEPANGVVRERVFLFGKKVLAEHTTPLNDFTEIFYKYTPGETGSSNFRPGLRHKAGHKLWIDGCWTIKRSVEETAWRISCDTGIKLKSEPVS